jgi:hypothetical protein
MDTHFACLGSRFQRPGDATRDLSPLDDMLSPSVLSRLGAGAYSPQNIARREEEQFKEHCLRVITLFLVSLVVVTAGVSFWFFLGGPASYDPFCLSPIPGTDELGLFNSPFTCAGKLESESLHPVFDEYCESVLGFYESIDLKFLSLGTINSTYRFVQWWLAATGLEHPNLPIIVVNAVFHGIGGFVVYYVIRLLYWGGLRTLHKYRVAVYKREQKLNRMVVETVEVPPYQAPGKNRGIPVLKAELRDLPGIGPVTMCIGVDGSPVGYLPTNGAVASKAIRVKPEMSLRNSTLRSSVLPPPQLFCYDSEGRVIGGGFRSGNRLITAAHVWSENPSYIGRDTTKLIRVPDTAQVVSVSTKEGKGRAARIVDIVSVKFENDAIWSALSVKSSTITSATRGQGISVTGPHGDGVSMANGVVSDYGTHPLQFTHTASTVPGFSGCPIYQGTRVIGVHVCAVDDAARPHNVAIALYPLLKTVFFDDCVESDKTKDGLFSEDSQAWAAISEADYLLVRLSSTKGSFMKDQLQEFLIDHQGGSFSSPRWADIADDDSDGDGAVSDDSGEFEAKSLKELIESARRPPKGKSPLLEFVHPAGPSNQLSFSQAADQTPFRLRPSRSTTIVVPTGGGQSIATPKLSSTAATQTKRAPTRAKSTQTLKKAPSGSSQSSESMPGPQVATPKGASKSKPKASVQSHPRGRNSKQPAKRSEPGFPNGNLTLESLTQTVGRKALDDLLMSYLKKQIAKPTQGIL